MNAYRWHDKLPGETGYDDGHRDMCRHGIAQFRRGQYDVIRFRVFSWREWEPITKIMAELAPDIPFEFETMMLPRATQAN